VIETRRPNPTPDRLVQRIQAELQRQQVMDTSPSAPLALRVATRQAQLNHIGLMLDAALQKLEPRSTLPGKLHRFPLLKRGKVQRFLFKCYNFLFKEQRTAHLNTIQAVRESAHLHQQVSEQLVALEEFQQGLHKAVATDVATLKQHISAIEAQLPRLDQIERTLGRLDSLEQQQLAQTDQQQLIQTTSTSISERFDNRLTQLEQRLQQLEQHHSTRMNYLQSDVTQQKRLNTLVIQQLLTRSASPPSIEAGAIASPLDAIPPELTPPHLLDTFYTAFEDEFRGSWETIQQRLRAYLPLLEDAALVTSVPVLDIGCGRGEWLDLLQSAGYQSIGLDLNPSMIERCQARHLRVVEADVLTYLQAQPDSSLAAVTGFHIVEHLPFDTLIQLMHETFRVLQPGGFILLETPNPRNILVSSFSFYLDPTHRNPIPSEVLQFLARYVGFEPVSTIWLNVSDRPHLAEDSEMAKRFNELFYGYMDYAVMGFKR
jgi:SAM-dependent methyltransferase